VSRRFAPIIGFATLAGDVVALAAAPSPRATPPSPDGTTLA